MNCSKTFFNSAGLLTAGCLMAVILFAGCLRDKPKKSQLKFDHQAHAENVDACTDCHDTSDPKVSPIPTHEVCESCHDIDMDAPGEDCLTCHVPPPGVKLTADDGKLAELLKQAYTERGPRTRGPSWADVTFRHEPHEGLECADCHGDRAAGKRLELPTMDQCLACHTEYGAPLECATCHSQMRDDQPPPSHHLSWLTDHGPRSELEGRSCTMCHQQNFCDDCHRSEPPPNHNAMFRHRGHGFFAEGRRQTCNTCHQTDFCQSCHDNQPPRSHTASFRRGQHCDSCHDQDQGLNKCSVCHGRAVHLSDVGSHSTSLSGLGAACADCHQTVTHAVSGRFTDQQCSQCHTGDNLAPAAHPLNLSGLTIGCNSCHAGVTHALGLSDSQCSSCHQPGPLAPIVGGGASHAFPPGLTLKQCKVCHTFPGGRR